MIDWGCLPGLQPGRRRTQAMCSLSQIFMIPLAFRGRTLSLCHSGLGGSLREYVHVILNDIHL